MKRKKLQELRAKKIDKLESLAQEAESQLVKLRMERASGKIKDTTALKKKRREIAIIKTLTREKQLVKEVE